MLDFFENLSSIQKLSWVFICLSLTWGLEKGFPLFRFDYRKLRHIGINMVFFAFVLIINLVFGILTVGIFEFTSANEFGLLYLFHLPWWLELIIAIVFLDLIAQYTVHYLLHKVHWMWRLHVVHHSDTHVDATTGTRHHPFDYVLREIFAAVAVFFLGAPVAFYIFYRLLTIFFTYMTHANFQLPAKLDRALSFVFITPNVHKFHHHHEVHWTDSNYGNVLSVWDRIFGTFVYEDTKDIVYGVDVMDPSKDEDLMHQFLIPFSKDKLKKEG